MSSDLFSWFALPDSRPTMSPDIFKKQIFPLLDGGEKVFFAAPSRTADTVGEALRSLGFAQTDIGPVLSAVRAARGEEFERMDQAEHSRAVGNHGHQIAPARIFVGKC